MSDAASDWPCATCLKLLMIHSLWLPLLGFGVCRKNQVVQQGWLLPALGLGEGQLKSQSSQRSTFAWRLCFRLCLWNSLQPYSSVPRLKLHTVGWDGFLGVELLLPPRLLLQWVVCSRNMASALWGMTQHREPGGCSSVLYLQCQPLQILFTCI